jgi:hypothetical protein
MTASVKEEQVENTEQQLFSFSWTVGSSKQHVLFFSLKKETINESMCVAVPHFSKF